MSPVLQAVVLALLGGGHCIAMCGVFSAAVGASLPASARAAFAGRMAAYVAGKAVTYAFLGVLAWSAGASLLDSAHLHSWRRVALGLAAATILLTGLQTVGWVPPMPVPVRLQAALARWLRPLRSLPAAWRSLPGPLGAAVLGFLNGFLPCGLVLAAVLVAASADAAYEAAGVMLAFGVATGPALLVPALAGRLMAGARRPRLRRFAGGALLALGAWTAVQAVRLPETAPPCCRIEVGRADANSLAPSTAGVIQPPTEIAPTTSPSTQGSQ